MHLSLNKDSKICPRNTFHRTRTTFIVKHCTVLYNTYMSLGVANHRNLQYSIRYSMLYVARITHWNTLHGRGSRAHAWCGDCLYGHSYCSVLWWVCEVRWVTLWVSQLSVVRLLLYCVWYRSGRKPYRPHYLISVLIELQISQRKKWNFFWPVQSI